MNKNKFGQETKWSLWERRPYVGYPGRFYIWVDEGGVVQYARSVQPLGFMPVGIGIRVIGILKKELRGFKKVINHKMTDEQLMRGELQF